MVSILTALLLIPLAAFAGAAMDYARLLSAHTALQGAVDAAALQAGGMLRDTDEDRKKAAQKVYDAQMLTYSGAIDHRMEINFEGGNGRVNASGWIDIPTVLLKVIGKDQLRASVASTITARQDQVNMALVLDVTGSLSDADFKAIKVAAKDLVDIVLAPDQQTDHYISLIPFAQFVNIGVNGATEGVLDKQGLSSNSGKMLRGKPMARHSADCEGKSTAEREAIIKNNFAAMQKLLDWGLEDLEERAPRFVERLRHTLTLEGQKELKTPVDCIIRNPSRISHWDLLKVYEKGSLLWNGCVEARPEPYDVQNDAPSASTANTLFVPFFQYDAKGASTDSLYANYVKDITFDTTKTTSPFFPINTYGLVRDHEDSFDLSIVKYLGVDEFLMGAKRSHSESICPEAITPLTHSSSDLKANIDKLVHVRAGGTNIGEGIAWGWRTISGNAPFSFPDGIADPAMRKRVLVVMTDGENNVNETNGWAGTPFKTQYTPYGHVGAGQMPGVSTRAQAKTYFDKRMKAVCQNAKAEGVEVYTVLFRSTSANVWSLLQECSSGTSYAFKAANSAALSQTFRTIAQRMSELYISN